MTYSLEECLPANLATVQRLSSFGADAPFICHVVEAYTLAQMPEQTLSILEHLVAKSGIKLICVEGAEGDISARQHLREYEGDDRRAEAMRLLRGGLAPVQVLSMLNVELDVYGVEDMRLHDRTMAAVQPLLDRRNYWGDLLGRLQETVQRRGAARLSPDLAEFLSNVPEAVHVEVPEPGRLAERTRHLLPWAKRGSVALSNYPHAQRLFELMGLEDACDEQRTGQELRSLMVEMGAGDLHDGAGYAETLELAGPLIKAVQRESYRDRIIRSSFAELGLSIDFSGLTAGRIQSLAEHLGDLDAGLVESRIADSPLGCLELHARRSQTGLPDSVHELIANVDAACGQLKEDADASTKEIVQWLNTRQVGTRGTTAAKEAEQPARGVVPVDALCRLTEIIPFLGLKDDAFRNVLRLVHSARRSQEYHDRAGSAENSFAMGFFNELTSLEGRIRDSLQKTQADRDYVTLFHRLGLLRQLLRLEITSEQIRKLEAMADPFDVSQLGSFLPVDEPCFREFAEREEDFQMACEQALDRYYRLMPKRSNHIADALLERMNETHQAAAILVTGGFHLSSVKQQLEGKRISHAVVTPVISRIEDDGGAHWKKLRVSKDVNPPTTTSSAGVTESASDAGGRCNSGT